MYTTYDYSSYLTPAEAGAVGTMFGALAGIGIFIAILGIAVGVLEIVAMWKIFTKAGEAGWKSIIPIYNLIILYKVSGINPLFVLIYLAAPIPFVGWLAILGITIYQAISLSKAFGKEGAYAVGLILLQPIFYMMLGLGSSEYVGPKFGDTETTTTTAE